MSFVSWSIHREDMMLLRALEGVHHDDGFYIDVGANSPQEDSVTKLFYDHGWHGLNVEPSKRWYDRLVEDRPRDINVHAACSAERGQVTLYDHPEGGLGTMVETFADRHEAEHRFEKKAVTVEAVTLTSLCERYAPPTINFLKIDVEGHEEQVLRGMDFSRFRPWILCIEATEPMRLDVFTHQAWDDLVVDAGYTFVQFDGQNRWYVANEHPERLQAFAYRVDDYVHWSYLRQIENLQREVTEASERADVARGVNRLFFAECYEILLGRELEDEQVVQDRAHLSRAEIVESVVRSSEFRLEVFDRFCDSGTVHGRFNQPVSLSQRYWAIDNLPIEDSTAAEILRDRNTPNLLAILFSDSTFVRTFHR